MEKKFLRKQIALVKKSYSKSQLIELSSPIINKILNNPKFLSAKYILLYHSLSDEVYTHDLVNKCLSNKTVLLPIVNNDTLQIREYKSINDTVIGSYGIVEPLGKEFTDYSLIDLVIVPGVAFDKNRNRLGRGKGFYDKFLSTVSCYKIGICFPFQILDSIPTDCHDIKMDEIIY